MSILPQLEHDLREASDRLHAGRGLSEAQDGGSPARRGGRPARRGRLGALVIVCLLGLSTAALATSGVIQIGSPVPADRGLHRESGLGVPLKSGATRLLSLRVPDPRGGPPWGMRIVRTSREEVCLQIGRVAHGRLGELGIDGAFHNDGELHPRPASALPDGGRIANVSNGNTHCALAGEAMSVADLAAPSSAAAGRVLTPNVPPPLRAYPRGQLRNLYFGLLGPQAVSITFREGGKEHTQPVAAGSGAYLIVRPMGPRQPLGDLGTSTAAPYGQLTAGPGELVEKITYRIHGHLCERGLRYARGRHGALRSLGTAKGVRHPCPQPAGSPPPAGRTRPVQLHRRLHARLHVKAGVVTGLTISFKAPYAVGSAREGYSLFLPQRSCHLKKGQVAVEGGASTPLARNVRRGARVSHTIAYPFRVKRLCHRGKLIVKAVYERANAFPGRTIVGEVKVKQPPGTRVRPKPHVITGPGPRVR